MCNYFVMLKHTNPNVKALPLTDEDDNVCWFDTEDDAEIAALSSLLGSSVGYQVFEFEI